MSDPSFFISQREILFEIPDHIEMVHDEIFLDARSDPGTVSHDGTCYGEAVRECRPVGRDLSLLKVHTDLHLLLLRQLRGRYRAHRVHRLPGSPSKRYLFPGEALLRFSDGASMAARRAALTAYYEEIDPACALPSGIYRLPAVLADDPALARTTLLQQPCIIEVWPVLVALPPMREGVAVARSA